jgi:hypothetical protein
VDDWQRFLDEVSWFLDPAENAVAGEPQPWARGAVDGLPELSALLDSATLTPVSVGDSAYELVAWGAADDRRGWLCRPPHDAAGSSVTRTHEAFWSVCGGIVERFGEPLTWWSNHDEVLTVDATRVSLAETLAAYAWLWADHGLTVPLDPGDYYAVGVEANGNLTLAHREDGRLLLFAPDHDFPDVTPLAGCPPYSLLTFDEVPDLTTWIERCAAAWRRGS